MSSSNSSVARAVLTHWKLALPALQESFLVCHTQAVLDAIQFDKSIATATVLETVEVVLQELQAIQEAAAALPSGSSKQHSKAQQTGADVDLKLFKKLRQVVVLLGALTMLCMHAAMACLVRRVMRLLVMHACSSVARCTTVRLSLCHHHSCKGHLT